MTKTLSEPTADQQVINAYNRGMAATDRLVLDADTKYALCLVKLAAAVEPADYPALKAAIEAITGVQEITLVVDHHTRATIPTGTQLTAVLEINLRLDAEPQA